MVATTIYRYMVNNGSNNGTFISFQFGDLIRDPLHFLHFDLRVWLLHLSGTLSQLMNATRSIKGTLKHQEYSRITCAMEKKNMVYGFWSSIPYKESKHHGYINVYPHTNGFMTIPWGPVYNQTSLTMASANKTLNIEANCRTFKHIICTSLTHII